MLQNNYFHVDQLSSRLSVMTTDHVLPLWPEMAPTASWAHVGVNSSPDTQKCGT